MRALYFDNAATSWPKPRSVPRALARAIRRGGGNPGRSGHRKAIEAGRLVVSAREALAELFHVDDPSHIVFTKNATEALNTALLGLLRPGDRVVTTCMEHNSVLRPLEALAARGVSVDVVPAGPGGEVDADAVRSRVAPGTRLVCVTHASNVCGAINDVGRIGAWCRGQGVPFLVDAAQTAGCIPIDVERMCIDLLAFSGHKGLLGPQGTGGLFVRDETTLEPLTRGGTGSNSDREDQPVFMPDRFESGTLNVPGLAGLREGVRWILERGVEAIQEHDARLRQRFIEGISGETRMRAYEGAVSTPHTGVASVTIEGSSPSDIGERLERRYGILTRIGLHCAPRAHKTLGTFPGGTVRLSWGPFTTEGDVRAAARALRDLAEGR
jgi:cysteine desulfurase / selenocysteine lyase